MRYVVVAVTQQALRLYPDLEAYKRDLERFFRLAEGKHARLIVFPERTGLMIVPPLIEGFRTGLLKKASPRGREARRWWERTRSSLMRSTAKLLGADLRREVRKALEEMPDFIWQRYVDIFAALAYEYKITVVAGSGYFRLPDSHELQHVVTVFGPDGDVLGHHRKVILDTEEQEWVAPGAGWHVVETPVGRLGITLGEEIMYPEVGRLLAYQGMEALVTLAAVRDERHGRILRDGLLARVTDNQVFGALGFTVGRDPLADEDTPPYRGRSVIFAPQGLTRRRDAVMVESGTATAEVVLTARWDLDALHQYWENAPVPVRRRLPVETVGPVLSAIYSQRVTLEEAVQALPQPGRPALPRKGSGPEADEGTLPTEPSRGEPDSVEPPPEPTTPTAEVLSQEESPAPPPVEVMPETKEEVPPAPEEKEPEGGVQAEKDTHEPAGPPLTSFKENSEGKARAEREAPPETPQTVQELTMPGIPQGEALPLVEEQTETHEEASSSPSEGEEIPPHLWETIKRELEEAARVLRSLTGGADEVPPAPEERPTSPPASSSASGKGWFHTLAHKGRKRSDTSFW